MIMGREMPSVCWEEKTALHVCFLHLTNTSNCLKDGQGLECYFCCQGSKCASWLKCSERCKYHVCCDSCTFCVLTGQTQKKDESPNTEKNPNKIFERCFFCRSVSCHFCGKFHQCCRRSYCRGLSINLWQVLAVKGSDPRVV